jgi:hypothetical protein
MIKLLQDDEVDIREEAATTVRQLTGCEKVATKICLEKLLKFSQSYFQEVNCCQVNCCQVNCCQVNCCQVNCCQVNCANKAVASLTRLLFESEVEMEIEEETGEEKLFDRSKLNFYEDFKVRQDVIFETFAAFNVAESSELLRRIAEEGFSFESKSSEHPVGMLFRQARTFVLRLKEATPKSIFANCGYFDQETLISIKLRLAKFLIVSFIKVDGISFHEHPELNASREELHQAIGELLSSEAIVTPGAYKTLTGLLQLNCSWLS